MLVGVCSLLEEAMKAIAALLARDYEAKLRAEKKGNWLHRHIRVLSRSVNVDLAGVQTELDRFHKLITLRNCIVHAWGKVAAVRKPAAVRAAAQAIETAEVSEDGYLFLGDQVVVEAIIAAENIADHILKSQLQVSMT